jgi:hypothetical protein
MGLLTYLSRLRVITERRRAKKPGHIHCRSAIVGAIRSFFVASGAMMLAAALFGWLQREIREL